MHAPALLISLVLIPTVLVPADLTAQSSICHSLANNTVFDNATSMGGPNLWLAIKTQAATPLVVTRVEIWTGEATGTNSLWLYSNDAVGNKPLASLGGASWAMTRVNGWQGATFATPIVILPNTDFWVVWAPINGAQASIQVNIYPGGPTYRGSFDAGQNWNGPYSSTLWKFRIFCGGSPGHFELFGTGCTGSNRLRPELGFFGVPTVGQNTVFMLERALASSTAFLAIGASSTSFGGLTLPFDMAVLGAAGCAILCSHDLTVSTPIDVTGQANLPLGIPNSSGLVGVPFYAQWLVLDPLANPLQLVVSNGGRAKIGD